MDILVWVCAFVCMKLVLPLYCFNKCSFTIQKIENVMECD